ncbi:11733_t:CDS:1 [Ambispora leptoticha]|uniref:11733_t:CDS:1 n=1 Tax=Ambispora leptoticha TaxID=144679 RepID=A0A9N9F887_9GLOM|nr:11733_t:CDS:1 [Ambispora leptoticha]
MSVIFACPATRAQKRRLERNAANANKTLRPLNSFFHYRVDVQPEFRKRYPAVNERLISKMISASWKKESAEVKRKYTEKAAKAAIEHRKRHPEYVFRPRRTRTLNPKKISVRFGPTFSVNSSIPLKVDDVQIPVGNQVHDQSNHYERQFMLIQYIPQKNEHKLLEECFVPINDYSENFSKLEDTEKETTNQSLNSNIIATIDQEIVIEDWDAAQNAADEFFKFQSGGEIDNLFETTFDIPKGI